MNNRTGFTMIEDAGTTPSLDLKVTKRVKPDFSTPLRCARNDKEAISCARNDNGALSFARNDKEAFRCDREAFRCDREAFRCARNNKKGFTMIDIAAVVAGTAFLAGILLPVLAADRDNAEKAQCSIQMRQYGLAMTMYAEENNQQLPWFAAKFTGGAPPQPNDMWFGVIEPYLSGKHASKVNGSIYAAKVRRCPGGEIDAGSAYNNLDHWRGWIGVNYGGFNTATFIAKAPFVYGSNGSNLCDPIVIPKVKHPESWMMLLDTQNAFVYTPAMQGWGFDDDMDGDGLLDTCSPTEMLYNGANPRVHDNGCNVGLVDGHVEWVAFKDLWKTNTSGNVVHTFWYNE